MKCPCVRCGPESGAREAGRLEELACPLRKRDPGRKRKAVSSRQPKQICAIFQVGESNTASPVQQHLHHYYFSVPGIGDIV